ncbi:MAG: 50S ribosomal protein L21 [Trueperaceae bacterium]|mgnify:FL=1|jgi:large subunit ribosomal protein L21
MFAIVKTGGKQYRVAEGDVLKVEKLAADAGTELELPVLLISGDDVKVGEDAAKAKVTVEVISHGRGPKLDVYKYKAKANYRRKIGHRQDYTEVRVKSVG